MISLNTKVSLIKSLCEEQLGVKGLALVHLSCDNEGAAAARGSNWQSPSHKPENKFFSTQL